jgi:hypothetical protein
VKLNGAKAGTTQCGFKIAVAVWMFSGMSNHFIADGGRGLSAVTLYQHPQLELGRASAMTFQFRLMEATTRAGRPPASAVCAGFKVSGVRGHSR